MSDPSKVPPLRLRPPATPAPRPAAGPGAAPPPGRRPSPFAGEAKTPAPALRPGQPPPLTIPPTLPADAQATKPKAGGKTAPSPSRAPGKKTPAPAPAPSGRARRDALVFGAAFFLASALGAAVYVCFPPAAPPPAAPSSPPAPAAPPAVANDEPPAPPPAPVAEPLAPAIAPAPARAGPRLVRYGENLRVSGVFQGVPARVLVDGRIVRAGDLLDPNLGVRFVGVDSDARHLLLEDPSGARLRVKY